MAMRSNEEALEFINEMVNKAEYPYFSIIVASGCSKCQHGYDIGVENPEEDWHSFCGAGHCYLCEQVHGNQCDDYAEGNVPVDKERF